MVHLSQGFSTSTVAKCINIIFWYQKKSSVFFFLTSIFMCDHVQVCVVVCDYVSTVDVGLAKSLWKVMAGIQRRTTIEERASVMWLAVTSLNLSMPRAPMSLQAFLKAQDHVQCRCIWQRLVGGSSVWSNLKGRAHFGPVARALYRMRLTAPTRLDMNLQWAPRAPGVFWFWLEALKSARLPKQHTIFFCLQISPTSIFIMLTYNEPSAFAPSLYTAKPANYCQSPQSLWLSAYHVQYACRVAANLNHLHWTSLYHSFTDQALIQHDSPTIVFNREASACL